MMDRFVNPLLRVSDSESIFGLSVFKSQINFFQAQEEAYNHPVMQNHIKKRTKFDLMLLSPFCDVSLYLGHHVFNAPMMFLVPMMRMSFVDEALGNPTNPAHIASIMSDFGPEMSFKERVLNSMARGAIHQISSIIHMCYESILLYVSLVVRRAGFDI
jgi:hypothetical protein